MPSFPEIPESHNHEVYGRNFVYEPAAGLPKIIHEDEDLIVIDKPSGLLSVPGKTEPDCAEARIRDYCPATLLVHRLDLPTSGVMVFAKNSHAQRHLGLQFEKRTSRKTYVARVWGEVQPDSGTINLPLTADWPNRPRQMVNHERGKPSVTDWEVLSRDKGVTRLILFPQTGRSHQLRVHCLELGHPILGDRIYAHPEAFNAAERLQLHAQSLSIRHPIGGEWIEFEAPCPF